jgi:hypothetical protein
MLIPIVHGKTQHEAKYKNLEATQSTEQDFGFNLLQASPKGPNHRFQIQTEIVQQLDPAHPQP